MIVDSTLPYKVKHIYTCSRLVNIELYDQNHV